MALRFLFHPSQAAHFTSSKTSALCMCWIPSSPQPLHFFKSCLICPPTPRSPWSFQRDSMVDTGSLPRMVPMTFQWPCPGLRHWGLVKSQNRTEYQKNDRKSKSSQSSFYSSNMFQHALRCSMFQVEYAKYPSRFHRVIEDMWISGPWDWLHHATRVTPPHLGTPSQEKDGQGMSTW